MPQRMHILDTSVSFAASKNRSYQESVMATFKALLTFLDEQGFTKATLLAAFEQTPREFTLKTDDLTDSGEEWVRDHLDLWLENRNRRKKWH